ncbi:restriction endonuclease subunit S [Cupriavidus nantongensis]|nr:restriction endonuclease subunit S [Cupriavidus nantongensis]
MSQEADLPNGWIEVEFGELFVHPGDDVVDGPFGSNLKASEYVSAGIPIARLQNIDRNRFVAKNIQFVTLEKADELERHTFMPNDILITKLGDPLGKACLAPSNIPTGVLVADVVRARVTHCWADVSFLCHQINSDNVVDQFKEQTKGTTRPRVNLTKIRALRMRLAPMAEQARIVAKLEELLSELDVGVAELKAAQKKLRQYRKSLLKAAVEGTLTAPWREAQRELAAATETGAQLLERILTERRTRWEAKQLAKFKEQGKLPPNDWQKKYPDPVQPNTTDLPVLPEGWAWASVDQAGDVQLGRQRAPQFHSGPNMVPYLRVANVFEDRIDISDVKEMHFSAEDEETFKLGHNDILLNEGQSLELVGRPAIYRNELPRACFTNTLIRFRTEASVIPDFALILFRHYMHSGRFRRIAKITTNIAHLGAGRFAELEFPLPSNVEQAEIVRRLSDQFAQIAEQEAAIERGLMQSIAQRQNILRAAFAGQLVPQDPNDEHASVLLERIRAERAERAKQPKTRKTKQKKEIAAVVSQLIDVLAEAGDWVPAQEAFRRCGVSDGALTDQIETLFAELRALDKAGRLAVEPVADEQGRKLYDKLKLLEV